MSRIIRLFVLFSAVLLVACGPTSESKVDSQVEDNKALIRREIEVSNQSKLDLLDEIYAADYIGHHPGSPDIHGIESLKQFASMVRTAFSDMKITIKDLIAEGDKVVIRWSITATHKGEFMGIPPTGVQATWTGIAIDRIAGGKIVEKWVNPDALGFFQQLGMELKPKEVEK